MREESGRERYLRKRSRRGKNEHRGHEYRKYLRIGLVLLSVLVLSRSGMDPIYGGRWIEYSSRTIEIGAGPNRSSSTASSFEESKAEETHSFLDPGPNKIETSTVDPRDSLNVNQVSTTRLTGDEGTSARAHGAAKKTEYSSRVDEKLSLRAAESRNAPGISHSTYMRSKAEPSAATITAVERGLASLRGETRSPHETLERQNETTVPKSSKLALKGHYVAPSLLPDMFRSDNIARVSEFVHRLIKTHRISSMIDISCYSSKLWMPAVLRYLEYEIPGFRYHCVVSDELQRANVMSYYKDVTSVEILVGTEYNVMTFPSVDLALMWNTVGMISVKQADLLFQSVSKARIKYVLLSNYPQVKKNSAALMSQGQVNARRPPYKLGSPLRIIQNVSVDPLIAKQILFYDANNIKKK
jgi:hypothetical protein